MTTVQWESHQKEAALEMSMPRIEKAIDRVENGIVDLRKSPTVYRVQEEFCLRTRRAETLLRVTWADRGGHYRTASLKRLVGLLTEGLAILEGHPVKSDDGQNDSQDIVDSVTRRLAWVRSIVPG